MSDRATITIDCDAGTVNVNCSVPFGQMSRGIDQQTNKAALICTALAPHLKRLMKMSREELMSQPRHHADVNVIEDVPVKRIT
jgi:hypothetical protein